MFKPLLVSLSIIGAVYSCGNIGDALTDSELVGLPTVYDSNGRKLGKALSYFASAITLITSEDYYVQLNWDGTFRESTAYYADANCTGTIFVSIGDRPTQAKILFQILGEYYKPTDVNSDGFINMIDTIDALSTANDGICQDFAGTPSSFGEVAEVAATTLTATGLPETISGPLEIGN